MKKNLFMKIIKIIIAIMVLLGLVAKHFIQNEFLEDLSFYVVAVGFVFLLLGDDSNERKEK